VLLAVPFLWPVLWWLEYVALVPWVVLLTRRDAPRGWLYFLVGALAFFSVALLPFGLFHWAVPLLLGIFYGPFLLPFAILLRRNALRFAIPLTVLVPVTWVAAEWIRLRFSIGQVSIFPLGTSQFERLSLIQIADVTGTAGVAFVVAMGSGAAVDVLRNSGRPSWRSLWPVGAFLAVVAAVLAYGTVRLSEQAVVAGPEVAIVQPNVTHYRDPDRAKESFEEQLRFTRQRIEPGSADLVILPENAVSVPMGDDPSYMEAIGELARAQRARVLIGSFSRASLSPPRVYTSAYYFSETGDFLARYHKLHLIPWAEYMPFESWLPRLSPYLYQAHYALAGKLLGYNAFGTTGEELILFDTESGGRLLRFAVPICFEVASSEFARKAVDAGADFLINITSEGVFGRAVYMHMLAHSRFRAIENRATVVRAGNNGISGIIGPSGRLRAVVRGERTGRLYLEPGSVVAEVPVSARAGGSFYTRNGEWLAYLCLAVSVALFAVSFVPTNRPRESSAAGT